MCPVSDMRVEGCGLTQSNPVVVTLVLELEIGRNETTIRPIERVAFQPNSTRFTCIALPFGARFRCPATILYFRSHVVQIHFCNPPTYVRSRLSRRLCALTLSIHRRRLFGHKIPAVFAGLACPGIRYEAHPSPSTLGSISNRHSPSIYSFGQTQ